MILTLSLIVTRTVDQYLNKCLLYLENSLIINTLHPHKTTKVLWIAGKMLARILLDRLVGHLD